MLDKEISIKEESLFKWLFKKGDVIIGGREKMSKCDMAKTPMYKLDNLWIENDSLTQLIYSKLYPAINKKLKKEGYPILFVRKRLIVSASINKEEMTDISLNSCSYYTKNEINKLKIDSIFKNLNQLFFNENITEFYFPMPLPFSQYYVNPPPYPEQGFPRADIY